MDTKRRIIPLRELEQTRQRLVEAVGPTLARLGFARLGADDVARAAKVPRAALFRHFQGLEGVVRAYAQSPAHWPSVEELAGGDLVAFSSLPLAEQFSTVYRGYVLGLRRRPDTARILCWETVERNRLACILEQVRVRRSLEVFELAGEFPDQVDMGAMVAVAAAAVLHLAVRGAANGHFGGVDLDTDQGWDRIGDTLALLFKGVLGRA
jgi:AcrR family transcriptional regulator